MFEHGYLLGSIVTALGIYASIQYRKVSEKGDCDEL